MRYTLSICDNRIFRRLYNKGKSAASRSVAVYFRRNGKRENRLGLTVGVKVGHAVVRNLIRRRLREIYRLSEELLIQGVDIVIVARSAAAKADYHELERELLGLFARLGLLK